MMSKKYGFTAAYTLLLLSTICQATSLDNKENIILTSDFHLNSKFTPTSSCSITGNGNTLFLGGSLHLLEQTPLTIVNETIINGLGNSLSLKQAITLTEGAQLTLRNITVLSDTQNHVFTTQTTSNEIILDNVTLNINQTQKLLQNTGNIVIHNNVILRGTPGTKVTLPENATLTIMPHAKLSIEGITFSCENKTFDKQISFIDETSTIHLTQSSFELLNDAMFTKGRIECCNAVTVNIPAEKSLFFGDGSDKNNNFNFVLLGGTSVKIDAGGAMIDRSV